VIGRGRLTHEAISGAMVSQNWCKWGSFG